ncbi:MAG: DMT family transporter [Pseudomonadota bacterium]
MTAEPPSAAHLLAERRHLQAIGLAVLAFACFTVLDTSAKFLGQAGIPLLMIIWARYAGHVAFSLVSLRELSLRTVWQSKRPRLQLLRAAFLFASTCCNFAALQFLQLAETASINFSIPLLVAALAVPVLGEHIGFRRWSAIVVGFLGVLIIVRPTPELFQPAALLSLTSATAAAGYVLTTRIVAQADHHETSNAYAALVGTALTTPLVAFVWVTPSGIQWLPLLLLGSFGGLGHYMLTAAHRHAPAPILAPFWYTQIVWMVGAGFLLFGDVPDALTLTGGTIVLASGLYVWWREMVKRRPASRGTVPPV